MWTTGLAPGINPEGKPIISILAKRTYAILPDKVRLADEQMPLVDKEKFDPPEESEYAEVIAESDFVAYKPTTDIIVLGKACTPHGKKAYHLDVEVRVGPLGKTVRVFGNRRLKARPFRGLSLTEPEPFCEMPVGYRHAYGGVATTKDGIPIPYPPNPIGKGFAIKDGIKDESELMVPNIESPSFPLMPDNMIVSRYEDWPRAPKPVSLGWTRRNFYPRYTYAGVLPQYFEQAAEKMETAKQRHRRPAAFQIPRFDHRFYQAASEGLWGKLLTGNEEVSLTHLDPNHPQWYFALPADVPHFFIDIGDGPHELTPFLQTVVIEMETKLLQMVWRGSLEYEGLEQLAAATKIEAKAL